MAKWKDTSAFDSAVAEAQCRHQVAIKAALAEHRGSDDRHALDRAIKAADAALNQALEKARAKLSAA